MISERSEFEELIRPDVTVIVQARMNSKRLPGKAMLDLAGKPLIYHVLKRCSEIELASKVVLATANYDENKPIIEVAESMGLDHFCGSEDNVLERYYQAARKFGGNFIVRATGDNPFVDVQYASMAIEIASESSSDLLSLVNLPLGTGVEVIKYKALETAYDLSNEFHHYEHVTPFIKEHPELFTIQRHPIKIDGDLSSLRLTVDVPEDYELARNIYNALYKGKTFSLAEVFSYLRNNPSLSKLNNRIVQRGMTHYEAK